MPSTQAAPRCGRAHLAAVAAELQVLAAGAVLPVQGLHPVDRLLRQGGVGVGRQRGSAAAPPAPKRLPPWRAQPASKLSDGRFQTCHTIALSTQVTCHTTALQYPGDLPRNRTAAPR